MLKRMMIVWFSLLFVLVSTSCGAQRIGSAATASANTYGDGSENSDTENSHSNSADVSTTESTSITTTTNASTTKSPTTTTSTTKSTSSATTSRSSSTSTIKIVDISQSYCRTMFLDSEGTVYFAGRDMFNTSKDLNKSKPVKIFSKAKWICKEEEDSFNILSIVDEKNTYYAMGIAPDGTKYPTFTPIMSDVKKASLGLILKQDNTLYIWGVFKDKYNDGSIPELDLNAQTPQVLLSDVKEYYGSYLHGYAIKNNGDLYTWGCIKSLDNYGFIPIKITSDVREVGAFSSNEWYITNNGSVLYDMPFHKDAYYHGDGPEKETIPQPVKIAEGVKTAWLNENSPAYITESDTLYMWGLYNTPYSEYEGKEGRGWR